MGIRRCGNTGIVRVSETEYNKLLFSPPVDNCNITNINVLYIYMIRVVFAYAQIVFENY